MGPDNGVSGNAYSLIPARANSRISKRADLIRPLQKMRLLVRLGSVNVREMNMQIFKRISMMIGLLLLTATMAFADAKTHKIAFHVDESDPKVMNMALNNVQNVSN